MRTKIWAVAVGLLVATLGGIAKAAVLITPGMLATQSQGITCTVVNLTTQARSVTFQIMRNDGTQYFSHTSTVAAGGATYYSAVSSFPTAVTFYCRITVPDAAKANLRGAIYNLDRNLGLPAE